MALFLRLLDSNDKDEALATAIKQLRNGVKPDFEVNPEVFGHVTGSPLSYWVKGAVRSLFADKSKCFEADGRTVKQGVATADDFRFVRAWWEISSVHLLEGNVSTEQEVFRSQTSTEKGWVYFSKGGEFSPYYSDLYLVIDWFNNGRNIRDFEKAFIRNDKHYFAPGLTWALRTQRGFNMRPYPAGAIFGHKGPAAFVKKAELPRFLGLCNSKIFLQLLALQMAFGSYEVGVIQRTPVPDLANLDSERLGELASTCVELKRELDRANEISHVFHLPALLQTEGVTLAARAAAWATRVRNADAQLARNQAEIDAISLQLYGITDEDRATIESNAGLPTDDADVASDDDETELSNNAQPAVDLERLTSDLVAYTVGCVFGRWDIRFATGELAMPELPDPFAPLPAYSPGMLRRDADALSALRPDEDGILADDEGNPADIVRQVRLAFEIIWGERAEAIERETVDVLGVKSLRDYFQKKGKGGFWLDHIQRYSKSRRKAPIYWLLQSPKGKYALWLYYPKLNGDTLAKALTGYVEPKLRRELERLATLRAEVQNAEGSGRRTLEREVERQEDLLNDIQEFRDRLERVIRRGLRPDHNDGVLLTIAPLWELTPWAEAKRAWEELQAGKYEWSSISKQLRGEYVAEIREFTNEWEAIELDAQSQPEVKPTSDAPKQEPRTLLGTLRLSNVGPAEKLELNFDERINILTGDNGLGKTFVLDAAWLALTGVDPVVLLRPPTNIDTTVRASIAYEIASTAGTVQEDNILYFNTKQDLWDSSRPQAAQGVAPRPGIVLFVHVDGTIAIWDRFKRAGLEKRGIGSALRFEGRELWEGKRHRSEQLSRGLIEDLREWWRAASERDRASSTITDEIANQAALFDLISNVLAILSPDEQNKLAIKAPVRISTVDTTEYPQIDMSYGDVPIVQASAAVQRILGLAYALVWAYREHGIAATLSDQEPSNQMIILIDEIELHLHPKWQRRILPALLKAIELLNEDLHAQIIITTHAPLVLASMEPHFEESIDQLFNFNLEHKDVILDRPDWTKQGRVDAWLTSSVFGLGEGRSQEAERAIAAANSLMRKGDMAEFSAELQTLEGVHRELRRVLPGQDPFWPRWIARMDINEE